MVAVPIDEVTSSLTRLVLIEAVSALVLLALLAGRRVAASCAAGCDPSSRWPSSARTITAGDLSQRVEPADERTEVGQLGLALNTMLGEIEEAFREREATEQRLRQFLSDASHELRTPLTSIQGFAELFRLGADQDRVDLAVILRRIEEETARMKMLVDDLLLLARLDETRPVRAGAGRPGRAGRRRLQRRRRRRSRSGRSRSTPPSRSSSPATATTCARPSPTW